MLEITQSLGEAEASLTWRTVLKLVHRYTRTLLVPAMLFLCHKGYLNPQRLYPTVIADGKVLSLQRSHSKKLVRVEQDVPVVALNTGHGACLISADLRGILRKRSKHEKTEPMRLSNTDASTLSDILFLGAAYPEPHPARGVRSREGDVSWAVPVIFSSFYRMEDVDDTASGERVGGGAGF